MTLTGRESWRSAERRKEKRLGMGGRGRKGRRSVGARRREVVLLKPDPLRFVEGEDLSENQRDGELVDRRRAPFGREESWGRVLKRTSESVPTGCKNKSSSLRPPSFGPVRPRWFV